MENNNVTYQAYKIPMIRMPFVPAEAFGHVLLKPGLPPLLCPHMQSGLVQESPKVHDSKYIHQEDMVFHSLQSALKDLYQSYMDNTRNPGLS